jgi:glycosyltransferase involved in cell wall biosynthesis
MITNADARSSVSVIVPVGDRQTPIDRLFPEYESGIASLGIPYEFVFVLDGPHPSTESALVKLIAQGKPVTVVSLTRYFGEATALMIGFERAKGNIIVTLPAHLQVEGNEIAKLVAALDDAHMAVGYREPRASNWWMSLRQRVFHGLLNFVTQLNFRDLGCAVRAFDRKVLEEVQLYGDQQRFLPLLAERQGFRVRQVPVRQSKDDRRDDMYRPRTYTRGFLDIFTVFFLVRFTKKPLRFFGMIGIATFSLGILELVYLVFERMVYHSPLADRPALLLASLLIVLGVQIFALGLLGELIIFTHAGGSKDYKVDRVIQYPEPAELLEPANAPVAQSGGRFGVSFPVSG